MTNPFHRSALLAFAGVLLTACAGSPPARYHALARADQVSANSGSAQILVELLPVVLPERLSREEMVMIGEGGRLEVRDSDLWAAPLSDEIRHLLAEALWQKAGAADVYRAPVPQAGGGLPQYRLSLRIERFDAVLGQAVLVDAGWSVRKLPAGAATICRTSFGQDLPGRTADAAAQAQSIAAVRLAEAIADSVKWLDLGIAGRCPAVDTTTR